VCPAEAYQALTGLPTPVAPRFKSWVLS